MFRKFCWASDSLNSKQTSLSTESQQKEDDRTQTKFAENVVAQPQKRFQNDGDCRDDYHEDDTRHAPKPPLKRARHESPVPVNSVPLDEPEAPQESHESSKTAEIRDKFDEIIGTEILVRHRELQLINNELAKCQAALEQLRRCHLIPYPGSIPTEENREIISTGNGPALQTDPANPPPKWAPAFGVADGPYTRHYARWLLPHPFFDGVDPVSENGDSRVNATQSIANRPERRVTRKNIDSNLSNGRSLRGAAAAKKMHALAGGQGETRKPKSSGGPIHIKRADGQTVQLVCMDCGNENFNSVQGYLNHCRIKHKREYKSHEEAAVKSGRTVENTNTNPSMNGTFQGQTTALIPEVSEKQAFINLKSRVKAAAAAAMEHSSRQRNIGLTTKIGGPSKPASNNNSHGKGFTAKNIQSSSDMPHLTRLLQTRSCSVNLAEMVQDIKAGAISEDYSSEEESDATVIGDAPAPISLNKRIPLTATKKGIQDHKTKKKGLGYHGTQESNTGLSSDNKKNNNPVADGDMESSLSPTTLTSNNAPSLVSDDGEYDDSDEGSSVSDHSDDSPDAESVTDVAEIEEHAAPVLGRGSTDMSSPLRLGKDDADSVSFVSPVGNERKTRSRK